MALNLLLFRPSECIRIELLLMLTDCWNASLKVFVNAGQTALYCTLEECHRELFISLFWLTFYKATGDADMLHSYYGVFNYGYYSAVNFTSQ